MTSPQPALLARDVQKSFGSGTSRMPILRGVSLAVERGEVVFLVGPSGSGKTTLLSLLGCLLKPDAGSIQVLGREVGHLSRRQLTQLRRTYLGFIFQSFNLFPSLSALDNVRLTLTLRGHPLPVATERALTLLQQVGLGERCRLRPAQLSTGECQRVAVARALADEPTVLLADEPTASLDAASGQAVMQLLMRLVHERGTTLLVVTHDPRIFRFADRIVHLEDGRLTHELSAEECQEPADALQVLLPRNRRKYAS